MYKLSLAFEQQAKPERAEAVLEWMKRTHGTIRAEQDPARRNRPACRNASRPLRHRQARWIAARWAPYTSPRTRVSTGRSRSRRFPIEKEFEDEELKEARLRFFREAESAGRLTHPNIITVFDAG